MVRAVVVAALSAELCDGHGHMTWPPNRPGALKKDGGNCKGWCGWFSQVAEIPGEPTLDDKYRTINVNACGVHDLTRKNPWRAPGTAPVRGSGCGVSGAGPPIDGTGPLVQPGTVAEQDGASLPRKEPTVWKAGSVQEVAWAINANHNGGYSWRLCKNNAPKVAPRALPTVEEQPGPLPQCTADPTGKTSTCKKCSATVSWSCDECRDGCARDIKGDGDVFVGSLCSCNPDPKNATPPEPIDPGVTEECFQQNTLKFATNSSWIEFTNGTRIEFPLTKVTEGTYPAGSEWARNPIPTCLMADRYDKCGPGIEPHGSHDQAYLLQAWCAGYCNGQSVHEVDADGMSQCPAGTENYPSPSGIAGYGYKGAPDEGGKPFPWSIVDKMEVPKDLATGDYLLSWRWDCEQGSQIWQSCADVRIEVDDTTTAAPSHTKDILFGVFKGLLADTDDDFVTCELDGMSAVLMFAATLADLQDGKIIDASTDLSLALGKIAPLVADCQVVAAQLGMLAASLEGFSPAKAEASVEAHETEILEAFAEASKCMDAEDWAGYGLHLGAALRHVIEDEAPPTTSVPATTTVSTAEAVLV